MIISETTLKRIQSIELDLLKSFIDCCNRLNIRYYLMGGSMLGAVRHKGFIPWDDDIDVAMMRNDYELFISEAKSLLPDYYFLQCITSEPDVLFNFAKIRDSRTTFVETSCGKTKINHGVYIDIFPLDYYPEKKEEQELIDKKKRELSLRIRSELTIPEKNNEGFIKESIRYLEGRLLSMKYPNVRDALLARDNLYKSVSPSNLIANYNGAWGKKEIVPASWYGDGVATTFEGIDVVIPTHYDKWLTQVYGNYMELPPVEKRVPHHYTDIIDLDKPYTEYIK